MKHIIASLPHGSAAFSAASLIYLLLMQFLTGLRPEHFFLILLMNLMFYAGNGTRKFILGFAIFAVFGMLYDFMRAFPNYEFNAVDIEGLYHFEKNLFGISFQDNVLTPNEYLNVTHTTAADLIAGFFYINWVPVPLAFAVWLYFSDRKNFLHFSLTFLLVNIIGFCGYYIHPAAPPWYVSSFGSQFHPATTGSAAYLSRFDDLVGLPVFHSIYTKNANVFAALPSLHCAYPVIVLFYAFRSRPRWLILPFFIFMLGIWFAAVYSGHHYVTDVILGVLCAFAGIFIYRKLLLRTKWFSNFFMNYLKLIE
jgi:membrane-associated phospholipid phosphatase